MNKMLLFFKEGTPIKLILVSVLISVPTYFIEKPLPSLFLGLRLTAFLIFIYAVYKFLNRK